MMDKKILTTPLSLEDRASLKAGELIYLSGTIYTGRDATHKRLVQMLDEGQDMPFDFTGQVIFYAGPSPTKPGDVTGSIGPTTSERMDAYSPRLMEQGLLVMIGKGLRTAPVIEAIKKHQGLYLAAIGGTAASLAQCILSSEIVAFEDLGTEAIRKLEVKEMPLIVAVDSTGSGVYFGHENIV